MVAGIRSFGAYGTIAHVAISQPPAEMARAPPEPSDDYCRGALDAQMWHDEPRQLLLQEVILLRTQLGERHPDTLPSINNPGQLLYYQGKVDEALPLLERHTTHLDKKGGDATRLDVDWRFARGTAVARIRLPRACRDSLFRTAFEQIELLGHLRRQHDHAAGAAVQQEGAVDGAVGRGRRGSRGLRRARSGVAREWQQAGGAGSREEGCVEGAGSGGSARPPTSRSSSPPRRT